MTDPRDLIEEWRADADLYDDTDSSEDLAALEVQLRCASQLERVLDENEERRPKAQVIDSDGNPWRVTDDD